MQKCLIHDLAVPAEDAVCLPHRTRPGLFNHLLLPIGQGGIFLIYRVWRFQFLYLLRAHSRLFVPLQQRKTHDRQLQFRPVKGGPQADGGVLGVDEFQVRPIIAVEADHGILAFLNITGSKAVEIPFRCPIAGIDYGVVQGGGDLTHSASRLLYKHAVLISARRLVPLIAGAVSRGQVKGELLPRFQHYPVYGIGGQTDILVSVLVICCSGGKCSDYFILIPGLFLGSLRRDGIKLSLDFHTEVHIPGSLHQFLCQLVLSQAPSIPFLRVAVGSGLLVEGLHL